MGADPQRVQGGVHGSDLRHRRSERGTADGFQQNAGELRHRLLGGNRDPKMLLAVSGKNADQIAVVRAYLLDVLDIIAGQLDVDKVRVGTEGQHTGDLVQRVDEPLSGGNDLLRDGAVIRVVLQGGNGDPLADVRDAVQGHVQPEHPLQRGAAEAVADAEVRQSVVFGERSRKDHVVVCLNHAPRVQMIGSEAVVSLIHDDQGLREVAHKALELGGVHLIAGRHGGRGDEDDPRLPLFRQTAQLRDVVHAFVRSLQDRITDLVAEFIFRNPEIITPSGVRQQHGPAASGGQTENALDDLRRAVVEENQVGRDPRFGGNRVNQVIPCARLIEIEIGNVKIFQCVQAFRRGAVQVLIVMKPTGNLFCRNSGIAADSVIFLKEVELIVFHEQLHSILFLSPVRLSYS